MKWGEIFLKERPKLPEIEPALRLERLNDLEAEIIQALRRCPPIDQPAVKDTVLAIVRSLTKNRQKDTPKAEVVALCDPFRKFSRT